MEESNERRGELQQPQVQSLMSSYPSFRANLRGELLQPNDDSYDATRKVFNRMIDKRPTLIARCAGAADVIKAISSPAQITCQWRFAVAAIVLLVSRFAMADS